MATYENFTTYTEVDADGVITVTPLQISWNNLDRAKTSYLVKDFGVDAFKSGLKHKFEYTWFDRTGNPACTGWGLSNTVGSRSDIIAAGGDNIDILNSINTLYLQNLAGGVLDQGDNFVGILNTIYYITIERNEAVYTATFRTGSHVGTVVDTLTITVSSQVDFRYFYACQTIEGGTGTQDGWVRNLDLGRSTEKKFHMQQLVTKDMITPTARSMGQNST